MCEQRAREVCATPTADGGLRFVQQELVLGEAGLDMTS